MKDIKTSRLQTKPESSGQNDTSAVKRQNKLLIPVRDKNYIGEVPLSLNQKRLWIEQMLQEDSAYNEVSAWKLKGVLYVETLHYCIQQIVDRHEILRTIFSVENEEPVQQVVDKVDVSILETDLSRMSKIKKQEAIKNAWIKESTHVYELDELPLFRLVLMKLDINEYVLIFAAHHIIFDGWSNSIFTQELAALYKNRISGSSTTLPPLDIQYADFAIWQLNNIQQADIDQQLEFWKAELEALPSSMDLGVIKQRPEKPNFKGSHKLVVLDALDNAALKTLCKEMRVTPFIFYLALFELFLVKYSNVWDITVGVPVTNRDQIQTQNLIGFFVNTLVMRAKIDDDKSFKLLLADVKQFVAKAVQNKTVPFEEVVKAINPERSIDQNLLFQYMFDYRKTSSEDMVLGDIHIESLHIEEGMSRYDLFLSILDDGNETSSVWEYRTSLFESEVIYHMILNFQELLKNVLQTPDKPLKLLNFMIEKEKFVKRSSQNNSNSAQKDEHLEEKTNVSSTSEKEWTEIEKELAEIWKSVLGVNSVRLEDNFFRIGGDSLTAIRIHNRILTEMGMVDLSITDLFQYPTIKSLASHLEGMVQKGKI